MSSSPSVSDGASGPLVTIAIPTFNRASWLKDCVHLALSQTYQQFEVLVSDNASTDETERVLKEFSDEKLRVLRQETNIGLLPNWNACLEAARGDYVIFVSDDDKIAPWLLERCIGLVKNEPQVPIVVTVCNLHSAAAARTWPGATSRYLGTGIWDGPDILLEYLREHITTTMCGIMLRTDALRANGGFPLNLPFTADVAAWAPLLLTGKAGLINEACATYYMHNASETSRLRVEQLLINLWKVADLISNLADKFVNDVRKRRDIQLQSRRCFARRAFLILSAYRKEDGGLLEVLAIIWRSRRDLSHIGMSNLLGLTRQVAIILFPRPIANWIRQIKRMSVGSSRPAV
jgi:glycosyltransferase involved in cell wall biosynthesis